MWEAGYGAVGSPFPRILLVAQQLGPGNIHNIPFEAGPTGVMLTDMLLNTNTPLGEIAITNFVKAPRRSTRRPNKEDLELFQLELEKLHPSKVIFMGSVALQGAALAKRLGIPYDHIEHLGYHYHRGTRNMSEYHTRWMQMLDMIPDYTF